MTVKIHKAWYVFLIGLSLGCRTTPPVPTSKALMINTKSEMEPVNQVAFTPDGNYLASGRRQEYVRIWDLQKGQLAHILDPRGKWHEGVCSVSFSPDGRTLACGTASGAMIRVWGVEQGQLLKTLTYPYRSAVHAVFSPDGRWLASVTGRGIKLWNTRDWQSASDFDRPEDASSPIVFAPDSRTLVSGSDFRYDIRLWNVNQRRFLKALKGHEHVIHCLAFSPDGRILASSSLDGTIRLWDASTGEQLAVLEGEGNAVFSVAFSPDGRILASGDAHKSVRLWDVKQKKLIKILKGHNYHVSCVAFSPNGRLLASGGGGLYDGTVRFWDVTTGECVAVLMGFRDGAWMIVTPEGWCDGARFVEKRIDFSLEKRPIPLKVQRTKVAERLRSYCSK